MVDRRTGLVYSEEELKILVPCPLSNISCNGPKHLDRCSDLLPRTVGESPGNSAIALIPIGNMPNDQLRAFSAELSRALKGRELLVGTDHANKPVCNSAFGDIARGCNTHTTFTVTPKTGSSRDTNGWLGLLDPELNLG